MPNWVINDFTITGIKKDVQRLVSDMTIDGDFKFDFERVLPTPKELLKHNSPSCIDDLLEYCWRNRISFSNGQVSESSMRSIWFGIMFHIRGTLSEKPEISRWIEIYGTSKKKKKAHSTDLKNGKRLYENLAKYDGCLDWYDWRIEHWGTKWNAAECNAEYYPENGAIDVWFQTAWNMPSAFLSWIAKEYDLNVVGRFADEDIGENCGTFSISKDACNIVFLEDDDAVRLATELWGFEEMDDEE